MSNHEQTTVTLTIAGDERDMEVRAYVSSERLYGGSYGATIDGDIEVLVHGEWIDIDLVDVAKGDKALADEAICDQYNDRSRCCA